MNDILFKIFSQISDGIIATDADGNILYMNSTAAQLTGWLPEQAKGQPVGKVFDAANETTGLKIINPVQEVIRTGTATEMSNHTVLKQRSGKTTVIEKCGIPIKDENEQVIGAVMVLRRCGNKPGESGLRPDSVSRRLIDELKNQITFVTREIKLFRNAGWPGAIRLQALEEMLANSEYMIKLLSDNLMQGKNFLQSELRIPGTLNTHAKLKRMPEHRQGHILVMDDDEMLRDLATRCLTRLGYNVTTVANGQEAVHVYHYSFGERTFDAVIIDLTIKDGMGGVETLQALKKINPYVKAIITSGYSNDPILQHYREYGFYDAICKPFGLYDLDQTLNRVLNQRANF